MNISTARFIIRYSLYLIIGLLTLSACKTKENEPINLEEVIETQEPLQRDTDIPLSLSMNLEEDQTTLRGLPLTGGAPDSPEYAPVRDWSKYDWVSDQGRPHILVAISNARNSQPTGGRHEVFKKLTKKEGKIVMKEIGGKPKPHVIIESHVTIPKGMKVDEFKVAVLVVDRAFGSLESFEQNGTISFDFSDEFYDISGQGKEFHNLVFVMEPQDIKNHMGKTGTNNRVKDIPFKLASTILVMEFADPENKGGTTPYIHVDVETDGFANKGTLSMSGANNLEAYRLTAPAPLTKEIPDLFPNPTSSATAKRYARRVTIALPTKGVEQDYNIKATYKDQTGSVTDSRDYSQASKKPKNSNKYAGKMLFIDFEIDEAPLDKAKYFQTKWNTGSDGKIIFYAAGIHNRNNEKVASTHKAKFYYRKSNSPSSAWTPFRINEPKLGEWDARIQPQKVELTGLDADTDYDIWMKNLSYFSLVDWWDNSSYGSLNPDLREVTLWGTSNEWGAGEHMHSDSEKVCPLRFVRATELGVTAKDKPNFKRLKCADAMFAGAKRFTGTPNINEWDMSSVVSMKEMFSGATSFNADISGWNVSNVTYMSSMFEEATNFNQNLTAWDISNVTNMSSMFKSATRFNQDLLWGEKFKNVSFANSMFSSATAFNGDISAWDTSSLQNANSMFERAVAFNRDISRWNVSKLKIMVGMFRFASAFNTNLGRWVFPNNAQIEMLFGRSGMSRANIQATLQGWERTALDNPSVMRDALMTISSDVSNDSWNGETNAEIQRILSWFGANRGWSRSPNYPY